MASDGIAELSSRSKENLAGIVQRPAIVNGRSAAGQQTNKQQRSERLALDALPTEIQQLIYHYAIRHEWYHTAIYLGSSTSWALMRVSKPVQDNLTEAVRVYGTKMQKFSYDDLLQHWLCLPEGFWWHRSGFLDDW